MCRKFRFAELALRERATKRRESNCLTGSQTGMVSRLPTEIYTMIINCLVNDRDGKSPGEMEVRAHTLTSLASTCRTIQILCERYLYTNLRSQRLSTDIGSQWLLYFALSVEPRRAHTIRSLRCESWSPYFQYEAWLEILRLCTNLTHLELVWQYSTPKNFSERLGNLVAACPNVTEFTYGGLWYINDGFWPGTLEQVARFSQQYAKFAKQLCHLEICGSIDCIRKILMYDYPNLRSFTINVDNYPRECNFFEVLASHAPSLERLELYWFEEANLRDLNMGFKVWGKTLRSLAINPPITRYTDGLLAHLLPHLTKLEDLYLGSQPGFQLSDLHAIAQPGAPRLKSFQWRVNDTIFWDFFANSETVNQAIIDIFLAHSETLNSFIIDEELGFWDFGTDLFEHLHKAKNLENLRVPLHYTPTEDEIEGLLTACPKFRQSETGLIVVREFLTACTLTTMEYKEDDLEAVESSWNSEKIIFQ
ncbi:hypothetical protein BFJ72_g5516 [Fusarium proliferatum]|uniref:F-box domain-containing protein n=1 Tax=Gibberella intermedia TaxID=948311 RepID=A0A420TJM0_GIBIN|nr:hypothetical protein BFJ72_g5516 [Fusarium proliferatum]